MTLLSAILALAVAVFSRLGAGEEVSDLQRLLRPRLSHNASIIPTGSLEFENLTARWSQYDAPSLNVVVSVATAEDVRQTILFANSGNMSFLAYSGGHGSIASLARVKNGIQISMSQMNSIAIAPDAKSVTVGGGAKVKDVMKALSAAGKRTVTGFCECVGTVAVLLGGGHGILQGQYGLSADQLISAKMVLGNGTAITISDTSHSDLFWAIRGAGHNFGIVTEYTYRIYDARPNETWGFEQFFFAGHQLKELYTTVNKMKKSQPPQVTEFALITRIPSMDPVNPIITYNIIYDGDGATASSYSAPIRDLGPLHSVSDEVPYQDLPGLTGNGDNDIACQKGATLLRFPIYLKHYNATTLQLVYDGFNDMMVQQSALNNSFFLLEGYSVQGVQKLASESTAFAHRGDDLLFTPVIVYLPNSTLDPAAVGHGEHFRQLLWEGSGTSELHSYVNYAHGDESLESIYGAEPWRLEKLRKLKKIYDAENKFGFYAPIY